MPTITDKFGHKIRVKEWPSTAGLQTLRTHYRDHHPKAWKGWKNLVPRKKGKKRMAKKGRASPQAKRAMSLFHSGRASSLKQAWAMVKGRRRGGNPGRSSSGGSSSSKSPGIGAAYQAAKAGIVVVSPVTDVALHRVATKNLGPPRQFIDDVAFRAISVPYAVNLGVTAVDGFLDKKTGQAAAISRGSVTAIAPEVYLGAIGLDQARASGLSGAGARTVHQRLVRAHQGYDPTNNLTQMSEKEFVTYRLIKHGGQAIRVLHAKLPIVKKAFAPVRKALNAIGGGV